VSARWVAGATRRKPARPGIPRPGPAPGRPPGRPGPRRPNRRPGPKRPRRPAQPGRPARPSRPPSPAPRPSPRPTPSLPRPAVPRPRPQQVPSRPGGVRFWRHPLLWSEVAAGAILWAFYTPQQTGSWDLAGAGFANICGPVADDPAYAAAHIWRFSDGLCTTPGCGTGNQSIAGSDFAPSDSSRCARLWQGPRLTNPFRYHLIEQWSRNEEGPVTGTPTRPHYYGAPGHPNQWPVDLPLPPPFWIPGGLPAPTPMPTPYPAVPARPQSPLPTPGAEVSESGNGINYSPIRPDVWSDPGTSLDLYPPGNPNPQPWPAPRFNPRPPGPKERELKAKWISPVTAKLWRLLGQVTEGIDFVAALYNALPKSVRRRVRAENNFFVTPRDKAEALWRYWREINLNEAMRQLIREQFVDTFYGRIAGTANRRYGELTGSPFGWDQSTQHDELLADFADANLDDRSPVDPGAWFDSIWPPRVPRG